MKSRWFLALAAILGLSLFSSLSVPVAAATPTVKLVLGGTGATPWAIGGIDPGSSGTNSVSLSNIGYKNGAVSIWVSDVVNSEGANLESETGDTAEPGELSNYLFLNVSGANLSANFTLPAVISDFPQSLAGAKRIYITPLKAFSTLNMQWDWQLPAGTGNNVQGDILSFTINYALEELPSLPLPPPPPGGGSHPQPIARVGITKTGPSSMFVGFARSYTTTVTNTGAVALNDVTVTDYLPELLSYKSSVPAGTVSESQISWNLGTLNIGEYKEIVTILGGAKPGAAVNTVAVTTREGVSASARLDIVVLSVTGATMSVVDIDDPVAVGDEIAYNLQVTNQSGTTDLHNLTVTGLIPGQMVFVSATGASEFTIAGQEVHYGPIATLKAGANVQYQIRAKAIAAGSAVFNATVRWEEFGELIVSQEGTTIFLPEPAAPAPSTTPAPGTPAPFPSVTPVPNQPALPPPAAVASFEVRNLTVTQDQVNPGEDIYITCEVTNTSGQSGEFTLRIDIPGLLQTSRLIKLDVGQTQEVNLTLPLPAGTPGTYQVNIGGAMDTFSIGTSTSTPTLPAAAIVQKTETAWWIPIILAAIGAAAMILCVIIIAMFRRRKRRKLRHYRTSGVRVSGLSSEQQTLYAISRRRRMAILAAAFARERNSKHFTTGRGKRQGHAELPK